MTIHIVKTGDTIRSIADLYKVSAERLIIDNGIVNPDHLAIGQSIVIVYPLISYTVKEGDTLQGIADDHGIPIQQLLRNNPYLSDRNFIYPGETLVISYDTHKIRTIAISGYAYSFISRDVLRKTLPFLTYLTVFNYQVTAEGDIIDVDDQDIVDMAKQYGVAPMMLISTMSEQGVGSFEVASQIFSNPKIQDRMIDNIINNLKKKGYYGLNQYLQYLRPETRTMIEEYIIKLSNRLKSEGYRFLVTITPKTNIEQTELSYEQIDYSTISQYVDGMLFLSYDWGYSFGPPASTTPVHILKEVMNHIVTTVPPEKLFLGLPVIGYDWPLPYVPGETIASAITSDAAVLLASDHEVIIRYNDVSAAPYYFYFRGFDDLRIVWYRDARSIDTISQLVPEYRLQGLSIWNIMYFFTQMWFVINNSYDIQKVEIANQPEV